MTLSVPVGERRQKNSTWANWSPWQRTCSSMPKTAFVILFSNVTVLFPRVTDTTFPLSLAHIVKTGTQRASNTTFHLQCAMPIRWITDSTWPPASFLSSALACVQTTRTWMCDCWILVPFICTFRYSAGGYFSTASKFTSALRFRTA